MVSGAVYLLPKLYIFKENYLIWYYHMLSIGGSEYMILPDMITDKIG